MLDGVAAGKNCVFLTIPSEDMAAGLVAEPMRLVNQRLEDRHRIRGDVLRFAGRRERIGAAGKQLDPIGAALDLFLYGGARLVGRPDDLPFERVFRCGRGRPAPADAQSRNLKSRAVDASLVDRVANLDVGVSIAMRAHVTGGGESGAQIGLRILDGNDRRFLAALLGSAVVEHVRVRVDHARQNRGPTEVDDFCSTRDFDRALGSHFCNSVAMQQHQLLSQHLTRLAVEQSAGAKRDNSRRGRTLIKASVRSGARLGASSAPRSLLRLSGQRHGHDDGSEKNDRRSVTSHRKVPPNEC